MLHVHVGGMQNTLFFYVKVDSVHIRDFHLPPLRTFITMAFVATLQMVFIITIFCMGLLLCNIHYSHITGDPPAFQSFEDPRDQFVFERDADGNRVSLMFTCPATGTDLTINW